MLAYGLADAAATPEIYYNRPPGSPVNAEQWTQIALYAITHLGGCQFFLGPLDEEGYEESNNSTQAWNEFTTQLEEKVGPYREAPGYCGEYVAEMEVSLEI